VRAIPHTWYQKYQQQTSGLAAIALKALGKFIDPFRTASWVRRHDVVIVPGSGVLETTVSRQASGFPYALFLLSASGRLCGTKVALVSVGADLISKRAARWLSNAAARLASYRSYRDAYSRDAMRQRGIDTSSDRVYPDLVFGVPTPPYGPGDPRLVGVGVMAYYGETDDREQATQIRYRYVETMTRFTGWMVDHGYRVKLFEGDYQSRDNIARIIREDLQRDRPGLDPSAVTVTAVSTYLELLQEIAPVNLVVATRYHDVMCALRLCKPTISWDIRKSSPR